MAYRETDIGKWKGSYPITAVIPSMAWDLAGIGALACVAIVIIIIIVFLFLWLFLKLVFAFFPSIIVALIVFLITQNWVLALVAFVVSALIFAAMGADRRRRRH